MRDITKFIIGLVQDYCNNRGYTFQSEKFALSFGTQCAKMLQNSSLTVDSVKKILNTYKSFVSGNDLVTEQFAVDIVGEICGNEAYIPAKPSMYTTISNFKRFVEGNVYSAFRVSDNPKEETGRSLVQTYLHPRGFREAQMSGGNSDLIYPTEKTIIETKIWHDQERYQDGIVELSSYLDSQGYNIGYYLIFDSTQSDNIIVKSQNAEVFDICHGSHLLHCFFIKINPVAPSKKRRKLKSKNT